MKRSSLVVLFVALLGCGGSSQNDPATYGRHRVFVAIGGTAPIAFASADRIWIASALRYASSLGPEFALVEQETGADLRVERWTSTDCGRAGSQTDGNVVRVDPDCFAAHMFAQAAIVHGLGRAVGMRYVCRYANETRDCSPVGYGAAVLNPILSFGDGTGPDVSGLERSIADLPEYIPTALDLAEARARLRQ